jgi:hypothetical protein
VGEDFDFAIGQDSSAVTISSITFSFFPRAINGFPPLMAWQNVEVNWVSPDVCLTATLSGQLKVIYHCREFLKILLRIGKESKKMLEARPFPPMKTDGYPAKEI